MKTMREQLEPIRSSVKKSRVVRRKRFKRASVRTRKVHDSKHKYVGYDWSLPWAA